MLFESAWRKILTTDFTDGTDEFISGPTGPLIRVIRGRL
jgi:hypothetical protein